VWAAKGYGGESVTPEAPSPLPSRGKEETMTVGRI